MDLESILSGVLEGVAGRQETQADRMAELSMRRQEIARQEEFEVVAERAITSAIERPNHQSNIDMSREQLSSSRTGPVGEIRGEITSSLNLDGPGTDPADNVSFEDQLEERVRVLYADLTNYQVAWRIAQKIPQDLSQILKGN